MFTPSLARKGKVCHKQSICCYNYQTAPKQGTPTSSNLRLWWAGQVLQWNSLFEERECKLSSCRCNSCSNRWKLRAYSPLRVIQMSRFEEEAGITSLFADKSKQFMSTIHLQDIYSSETLHCRRGKAPVPFASFIWKPITYEKTRCLCHHYMMSHSQRRSSQVKIEKRAEACSVW